MCTAGAAVHSEETILELIDLIYRAVTGSEGWPVLLERLSAAVDGRVGTIHHQVAESQESNFSTLWNVGPDAIDRYTAYYGFRNPLMTTRPQIIQTGRVNTSQMLCSDEIMLRSEYYNDYLRQLNLLHCVAATLQNDGANSSNLTIFRSPDDEPFGEEECRLIRVLMPHLQRAFQLHSRIHRLEKRASVLEETLDQLPSAVVLLDCRG